MDDKDGVFYFSGVKFWNVCVVVEGCVMCFWWVFYICYSFVNFGFQVNWIL